MTVGAFAAEPIDRIAKAENNCFTSGHYGSAESTGNIGADVRKAVGSEPHDAGTGLVYTKTFESVTDDIQWTLKDGVLTLSGNGVVAKDLNYVFGDNTHIETIVIEEGVNHFPHAIKDLPNLKNIIVMDGNIRALTLFSNCPNVQAVIVGANLKDSIYSGFAGKSREYSGDLANKFIILTKNIGLNYKGAQLRSDFNGYSNGRLCVQDGKIINSYGILAFHSDDVTTASYKTLLNKARTALENVPASVIAKLPAELFAEHEEEPIEPIRPAEPVIPGETTPETMTGTNDFTNGETRLRTSHNENNYVDIAVSGNTMTVSGRLLVDGLTKVQVRCGSQKQDINVSSGELFSMRMTLKHSGYSAVNIYVYQGSSSSRSYVYNRIYIEKTSGGYRIMPSLAQENNTAFEQSYIDPAVVLNAADVPGTVAEMSRAIVGNETNNYTKVFLLHKWVAENIYYDYDALANPSLRSTDSAKILEDRRGVCAGYSALLRDLILAQNIPAIYSTNCARQSGSYALSVAAYENHAHTEAYVDGRWITIDATWDSNNEYRGGRYTAKAPTGFYYFDISSEAFAMDHKIESRGGKHYIIDKNGFGIRPSDGALVKYEGRGGDIVIPDGVTSIEWRAFYECSTITGVTIPNSVTKLGREVFSYCKNLRSVTLPESIKSIPEYTFIGCTNLRSVVIPDGITAIGVSAFSGCSALESIIIPDSVRSIGSTAFFNCRSLERVVIPGSIVFDYNDQNIFLDCTGLTSVTIGHGITELPGSMFQNCTALTSVSLPGSLTAIQGDVFRGCAALRSISIPDSVTAIGYRTFRSCSALTDVYYGGTEAQWAAVKIGNNDCGLKNAVIHCSDATIGNPSVTPVQPGAGETPDMPVESPMPEDPTVNPGQPEVEKETVSSSFSDVSAEAYYTGSVAWAVKQGITTGTSATTFSPNMTCTNAHILTFLWRAYGSPQVAGGNAFTDVAANAYYYQAAQWAKNLGMVNGSILSPNAPCTRAATVMFLWQAAGCPAVTTPTGFTDVSIDADYAMAVAWALEKGITSGTSATTFSPDSTCTRAQIVTFLYRALESTHFGECFLLSSRRACAC